MGRPRARSAPVVLTLDAGALIASNTDDVVDATVALCARERGGAVVTSDAADLRRIDPALTVIAI